LQRVIATAPGWTTQNNGLLHIRGVDDGILYVVDGIPTVDRLEQELAGQRQRQELRDNSQSFSWQRLWTSSTITNLAYFRRDYKADLFGSENDTPIFAEQDRRHTRHGLIASVTHVRGKHTIKSGLEASRVAPREIFTFAITDEEEAEELEISESEPD
jgi:hypothetical protein